MSSSSSTSTSTSAAGPTNAERVVDSVREYYGKVLSRTSDLKTSACTPGAAPPAAVRAALALVPDAVLDKFYGCGNPVPAGIAGLSVLDLGCGSGRDVFVASALVGPTGRAVGVDMTAEQLATARASAPEFARRVGYSNTEFKEGYIERLEEAGVAAGSFDLVVSNCVVNLSPDKPAVLRGVYRALREGGEFLFSDVYCDRRLPADARADEVLWGECVSGAMYEGDFLALARRVGFLDPREVERTEVHIADAGMRAVVGRARFYSVTYRLFKLPVAEVGGDALPAEGLEERCEDYGQVAVYRGTVPGSPFEYALDAGHVFEAGRPALVCGNTALMLQRSWLRAHFDVTGDRKQHFGIFNCGGGGGGGVSGTVCSTVSAGAASSSSSGGAASSSSCCAPAPAASSSGSCKPGSGCC